MEKTQLWLCKNRCGYALGVVRNGRNNYPVLDVFRSAQPVESPVLGDYCVEGLESGAPVCSNCKMAREWHLSDYAMSRMLSRMSTRQKARLSQSAPEML